MSGPVIAIDGPAGSGKSTLARRLAQTLDLPYVNTGLMYRAVTLEALSEGLDLDDGEALAGLARRITFDLDPRSTPRALRIGGREPSPDLSSAPVERHVSRVSAHGELRRVLHEVQRRLARGGAVVEGRDIGSVVLPDAEVKIFLRAPASVRAARRARERGAEAADGDAAKDRDVVASLRRRDRQDERLNPFVPPPGGVALDTRDKDADAVFREALTLVRSLTEDRR